MRRRDKLKNIDRANVLAEQRYLKSKGLLKENSVTQALMGAANSGNLGGGIYDIVKNFGKNAVLVALQALMGSGDIDPQGVKNIDLIQTIQKLQEGDETIVEAARQDNELKELGLLKENSDNNLRRMGDMLKSAIGARETPNWTDASDSHRNDMVYMSMLDSGVIGIAIPAPLGEDRAKYIQSKYNEIAAKAKEGGVEFETKFAKGEMGGTNKMPAYTMMIRLKGESQQEPQQQEPQQQPVQPQQEPQQPSAPNI